MDGDEELEKGLENRKEQSPEGGGTTVSPKSWYQGPKVVPPRKTIRVSGRTLDSFQLMETELTRKLGRVPTQNESIQFLLDHQSNSQDILHVQLKSIEGFIKVNFSASEYAIATYLFALLKQCTNKTRDPEQLRTILERVLANGGEKK